MSAEVGVVAIGRNEGERLVRCLSSLPRTGVPIVYVDSGSLDGSPRRAAELGATVVELDVSQSFTAARARNAGSERLQRDYPGVELVQFLDGDCEIQPEWLQTASRYLAEHPDVAVVCGRRRERHPGASLYNRLTDIEWDTPVGEADSCGGDAMIRLRALAEVGGYDAGLIAGEDPELCLRIRRSGFRIVRLDQEMTLHDAALLHFGQWWRRQRRSGHAYAEVAYLHRRDPDPLRLRRLVSALAWGTALPVLSVAAAWPTSGVSLALLGSFILLWARVYEATRKRGRSSADAVRYAGACMVSKFAECQGVLTFAWNRLVRRRPTALMEYKAG